MEVTKAIGLAILTVCINVVLMLIKLGAGVAGNSYALIADGIESAADIFTSLITWSGYQLSLRPPDDEHPFGHGKYESLAGMFAGASLLGAAVLIAYHAVMEIRVPSQSPAWFTLPVLLGVVATKWVLSIRINKLAGETESRALQGEAWHHISDAMTSGAAAIGITVALAGGPAYASADDWAALFACLFIAANGVKIIRGSLNDALDGRVDPAVEEQMRQTASKVPGVAAIDKCRLRKSGTAYFLEIHVQVDGDMTVTRGHTIGHEVKAALLTAHPRLMDVTVHLEPVAHVSPPLTA